jgi:hypothetical protein
MCTNCLSSTEAVAASAAFVAYAVHEPVHRALAACGLMAEPDPVAHDVRTVAFLRSLDLDPVAVLGHDAVAAAGHWAPAPRRVHPGLRALQARFARWAASRSPIGSHSALSAQ